MNTSYNVVNGLNKDGQLNILIIGRMPFGFLTDAYELSKYLTGKHIVTYLCFDSGKTILATNDSVPANLHLKKINRKGCLLSRAWKWLTSCISACRENYDLIYLYYFPLCSLVRLPCQNKVFILDIRSGSTLRNPVKRWLSNLLIRVDSLVFEHISVVCESMRDHLHLPSSKTHICPLGANPVDITAKKFSYIHLLYVGTFFNRNLDDTIRGFGRYFSEYSGKLNLRYTLVGDSFFSDEWQRVSTLVRELGLQEVIDLPGYIPRDQLKSYFEQCNVGVSYVPTTPYYDCQPPTKTFEYLFAGMPVIATATTENKKVIKDDNGVLIGDTPEDFYRGLCTLTSRLSTYDSRKIKDSISDYSWHNIVINNALPFIESVIR